MDKLQAIRTLMHEHGIYAYLVPMADRFNNEYVPAHDRELEWLTGFTGSNGFAIITESEAAFFTDGRYTLQAESEVDQGFQQYDMGETRPSAWLKTRISAKTQIGFDAWRFTLRSLEPFVELAEAASTSIAPTNDIMQILWKDRPKPDAKSAFIHDPKYAGATTDEKRQDIEKTLEKEGAELCLLCDSTSINWLLNIRGYDLPHTPVLNGYLLYQKGGEITLYADLKKTDGIDHINCKSIETIIEDLELVKGYILLDELTTPIALCEALYDANMVAAPDPCILAKACKNKTEQAGMKACHETDALAVIRMLAWLETEDDLDELKVIEKLAELRAEGELFHGLSFDTIAGYASNGAIIHYRADENSNKTIEPGSLLLIDSGGQYLNGTTDITRTIAIGEPTDEMCTHYTQVLKGHIALARATFPHGTTGHQLDTLAREPLWQAGSDFAHGTGHGVGYMLNVHEGPQNISARAHPQAILPGMVTSNEPGYYKRGKYGIRIENLILCVERGETDVGKPLYGFEDLTLVPYDRRLIDVSLLTATEIKHVNAYHQRIADTVSSRLPEEAQNWLKRAIAPLDN